MLISPCTAARKLNTIHGEFIDSALEAACKADRLPELARHAELCFAAVDLSDTVLLGTNGDRATPAIRALHAAGFCIALDDFGTGYASPTLVKQYPVHAIKIDGSFVRDLEWDANDAAIVAAVLQLGVSLGLDVTAEGWRPRLKPASSPCAAALSRRGACSAGRCRWAGCRFPRGARRAVRRQCGGRALRLA